MPLPKAPTKPASLISATDDLLAKPRKTTTAPARPIAQVAPQEAVSAPALAASFAPEMEKPRAPLAKSRVSQTPPPVSLSRETREPRRRSDPDVAKTFVLDTNVLMHDPSSLFRFEEHDVFLPMMTLEELDNHKKGMSEVARNVRQVTRSLDALIDAISGELGGKAKIGEGIPLDALGHKDATGRLYFQTEPIETTPIKGFESGKADNQILGVVKALQARQKDRVVVLVSKDINIRIKAHALGLPA